MTPETASDPSPSGLSGLSVLLVDDEVMLRDLGRRILTRLGISRVAVAENGREALRLLAEAPQPFDVIVCDLNMPGMDGLELVRHLADLDFDGGLVLLSGEDERILQTAEKIAIAHRLRVLGALGKPLRPAAMAEMLQRLDSAYRLPLVRDAESLTESDIRAGIARGAVMPYFQPKVALATGRPVGAEVLARWDDGSGRVLGPETFIPRAEECGLIDEVTHAVLQAAVTEAARWKAEGMPLNLAINFSVEALTRVELVDHIETTAAAAGLLLSDLTVEVTESRLLRNVLAPLEVLTRLRMKGARLAIDDFGTGYSSLEQLRRLPFTELKIDRAFVAGAERDPATRAILESSIDIARRMNLALVAEGAESAEDWALLSALGVEAAQGFYVSHPLAPDDFHAWLRAKW